jgi:hypothetical protein
MNSLRTLRTRKPNRVTDTEPRSPRPVGFRRAGSPRWFGVASTLLALSWGFAAAAHPLADLEVGDPLEAELRALDVLGPPERGRTTLAPHLFSLPVPRSGWMPDSGSTPSPLADISWRRLTRELNRDLPGPPSSLPAGSTPYLARLEDGEGSRFDLSAGVEMGFAANADTTRILEGSGVHLRAALGFDRWILQTHWLVGVVDSARSFADPLVAGQDVIAQAEQASIGYVSPGDRWGVRFGRGRWHWGPGNEASLVLSRTAAPLSSLEFHASLAHRRFFLTAMSATLRQASGDQLAAHRIEWQVRDGLRFGASELAIYHGAGWRPLYVVGIIPYTVSQRLESQDDPNQLPSLRNNVMVAVDGAWRIASGTRVYGEFLVDDLHTRTNDNPDKLAFQLGWDGIGRALGTRLRWNGEYTRLSRYVYTSYHGLPASAQGLPLGFPTGPDAGRLRVAVTGDPSVAWEWSLVASHTEKGEGDLSKPFVPGSPQTPVWQLSGVVERTRSLEGALRWWPSASVDLALRLGYDWRENADHVDGRNRDRGRGALQIRLTR